MEISPVFGMTLLEFMDVWTMMWAAAPAAVAVVIWVTHRNLHRSQLEEQKRQAAIDEKRAKLDSAELTLELMTRLYDPKMQKLTGYLDNNQPKPPWDENTLQRFLNHMDLIAMYYEDKLLEWSHVRGRYGGLFYLIGANVQVKEFMDRTEYRHLYNPLRRMITRVQEDQSRHE